MRLRNKFKLELQLVMNVFHIEQGANFTKIFISDCTADNESEILDNIILYRKQICTLAIRIQKANMST